MVYDNYSLVIYLASYYLSVKLSVAVKRSWLANSTLSIVAKLASLILSNVTLPCFSGQLDIPLAHPGRLHLVSWSSSRFKTIWL